MTLTIGDIYRTAYQFGMEKDYRGAQVIRETLLSHAKSLRELCEKAGFAFRCEADDLEGAQQEFERIYDEAYKHYCAIKDDSRLTRLEKARKCGELLDIISFTLDDLKHPYYDTRILFGEPSAEVKKVLVGIDITPADVALAKQEGALLIAHHPQSYAAQRLPLILDKQPYIWEKEFGIPLEMGLSIIAARKDIITRKLTTENLEHTLSHARLEGVPLICIHTPCDNLTEWYLVEMFRKEQIRTARDIVDLFLILPEFEYYRNNRKIKPQVHSRLGCDPPVTKYFVDMAGGTAGPEVMYEFLGKYGVGTLINMHIPELNLEEAYRHHMTVIVAGHHASDSLGVNLMLDEIERRFSVTLECLDVAGFKRFKRGA
ncbi:MAG: hypothetical protein RDV48_12300 [Candidatus Eremiobacteraeota bacterium]|nr:hypothetical protein [Candidatus Eremiobacteraeota bacterium]